MGRRADAGFLIRMPKLFAFFGFNPPIVRATSAPAIQNTSTTKISEGPIANYISTVFKQSPLVNVLPHARNYTENESTCQGL
jgi:hypothetical protein